MTPRHWIRPEQDRPEEGQLRIVKLENGRLRAAVWRQLYANPNHWYCDRNGDGIDGVVEVGAPKPKRKSGPSGQHTVPRFTLRVTPELWEQFGALAEQRGTNRNAALRQFMRDYCGATGGK